MDVFRSNILTSGIEIGLRALLWVIYFVLDKTPPFMRHIDEDELWQYRYPVVEDHLPPRFIWIYLIVFPFFIFAVEFVLKRNKEEILNCINCLSISYPIVAVITQHLKTSIGRPRPNFFARCFPNGYGTDFLSCTGNYRDHLDARKSFPSLNTTYAFTMGLFLTCHLVKATNIMNVKYGKGWRYLLCIAPILTSTLVAIDKTCSYHHHYSDVIGAGLIGSLLGGSLYFVYCNENTHEEK